MIGIKSIQGNLWFHIAIAFLLLPLYSLLGESFKYVVAPYVLYLVWSKNPTFLPALFIHFTPGSTISILILLMIFGLTVVDYSNFKKIGLGWLLFFALLPLPIFAYQTIERIFVLKLSLTEVLIPFSFYLGLFPFFYGIQIAPKFTKEIWNGLVLVLLLLPFLKFVPMIEYSIRAYWFSFPLFFGLASLIFLPFSPIKLSKGGKLISILFLIASFTGLLGIKFTLLFSGLVTFLVLVLYLRDWNFLLNLLARPLVIILCILLVVSIINGVDQYGSSNIKYNELSYTDPDDFWTLLQYKAFDDRAVIWAGGWDLVTSKDMLLPPYEPPSYEFISNRGAVIEDVEFGIHNIGLELMRNYGLLVGSLITVVYLLMIVRSGQVFFSGVIQPYVLLFAAVVLGTGLVGGLVGQFVLMNTFSLILMSLAGVCFKYSQYREEVMNNNVG